MTGTFKDTPLLRSYYETLADLDWTDILVHMIIPMGVLAVASLLGTPTPWIFLLAGVNAGFWPVREDLQADDDERPILDWSLQKHMEAWPPVLTGFLQALAVT